MAADILVFGTIAVAVVAWAVAEIRRDRRAWAAGALLAVTHSAAAFVTFYSASHTAAQLETLRQTAAATGIVFSGGIYINYVFLAVWTADALWWLAAPASHASRPRVLSLAIRGFIFFIIVSGAVVFADGWARVIGAAAVLAVMMHRVISVLGPWPQTRSSRRGASTTDG